MNVELVKEIANAILYEGYLLYPYRPSAIKNRQRWTFGVVYPRDYSEANGGIEPWVMQTECLVAGQHPTVNVTVRFLHLVMRTVVQPEANIDTANGSEWSLAGRLIDEPRQEGVERQLTALGLSLEDLVAHPRRVEIMFPNDRMVEYSDTEIVRDQRSIVGGIIITAESVSPDLFKLRIQIENTTPETSPEILQQASQDRRDTVFLQSLISTHTILHVEEGSFVSLLEPPEELQGAVQGCQNLRTWPVLVGGEGEHDAMLSSPIILYDYPQIAPESLGPLFDGTEIDEILILRIITLTDEEKQEMRKDERTREILERVEAMTPDDFMKLHGVIRSRRAVGEGELL